MKIEDIIYNSINKCTSACGVLVEVRSINTTLLKAFNDYLLTPARIMALSEFTAETALKKLQEIKKGM